MTGTRPKKLKSNNGNETERTQLEDTEKLESKSSCLSVGLQTEQRKAMRLVSGNKLNVNTEKTRTTKLETEQNNGSTVELKTETNGTTNNEKENALAVVQNS